MISKTGIHATLALTLLAKLPAREYAGAAQIAADVGAPGNYLGKLLKQLTSVGLVESQKGYGGGFRLAKPATRISLYDVLEPLEHVSRWNGCFLGNAKCNEKSPCAAHNRWVRLRSAYLDFLRRTSIADLAEP